MRHYAAENLYGTSTSHGFANTWYVVVFDSAAKRDAYVEGRDTITAKAISRRQVTSYVDATPKCFSTQHYAIINEQSYSEEAIGVVGVAYSGEGYERVYR